MAAVHKCEGVKTEHQDDSTEQHYGQDEIDQDCEGKPKDQPDGAAQKAATETEEGKGKDDDPEKDLPQDREEPGERTGRAGRGNLYGWDDRAVHLFY
jgi:hypothetical protein